MRNGYTSRKVAGGWQGLHMDEGDTLYRCPHVHASRAEAADCVAGRASNIRDQIDERDEAIFAAYEADEIDADETIKRLLSPT